MTEKGLCNTCVNDKSCAFPRKFPVLQCEEFTTSGPKSKKVKKEKHLKKKFT